MTNYIIAAIGLVFAILTYFAGSRKSSNADVEKRAYFEGEIGAKLDQVLRTIEKIEAKMSKNTEELYSAIEKKIQEHERRYHNG